MEQPKVDSKTSWGYQIMVELFAAKDLVGSKLKRTPDPYAIITCGNEKRFRDLKLCAVRSSMIHGSRNPLWGEDFKFSVHELPVQINVEIYDWNVVRSIPLGSVSVGVKSECRTGAAWHTLESPSGQVVSLLIETQVSGNVSRINGYGGANPQRRMPPLVHQNTGPLQTIFGLHPNEVVIPFEDIEKIQKSAHAMINPAITIILREGAGGRGVPPLKSRNDRATYMFASFLSGRNRVLNDLQQRAEKNFNEMLEVEKEKALPELCAHCSSGRGSKILDKAFEDSMPKTGKLQPTIQGEASVDINNEVIPRVAELFSKCFIDENHSVGKDSNLVVFENVKQAHDVPSGSYSEITYYGALLEVCMKKLVSYPEVASFIEDKNHQFPSVKVCDVLKSPPKLIMLDHAGQREETIRIDNWKREHILQFLREKAKPLAADSE
ncbi:hypothetical protein VNO80_20479 [Phaseolus coccineus]|uniref:C2 domain-containing protein n=1 Tax=Phaseolus coccineus TaxID=3886 RepID=A0AAN9QT74_PHACN